MALVFLLLFSYIFLKKINKTEVIKYRQIIIISFVFYIVCMFVYEYYVEYRVGWEYGIPFDDDTGWIFKAASAMHKGVQWNKLYLLVQNRTYDSSNRTLGFNTLGQYLYAFWVNIMLYYPEIFAVKVNLCMLYIVQILAVFCLGIDMSIGINGIVAQDDKKTVKKESFLAVFYALIFCPIIMFNSFKLLRETWYTFFMTYSFLMMTSDKDKINYFSLIPCGLIAVMLRSLSVILLVPIYIFYVFNKKLGSIINYCMGILLITGGTVINVLAKLVGWNYDIGNFSLNEVVHFLFFPSIVNQAKNLAMLNTNPSWVVLLYFWQSVWNVIYIVIAFAGIYISTLKSKNWKFWLVLFINCLAVYTYPYDIENLTPRYKISFIIPMIYFICWTLVYFKNKIKFKI